MPFSFKQELRFPGGLVRNPKAEHVWPNGDKRWVLSLQFLLDWCTMAGKLSTGGDAWWRIILLCAWTSGRWLGFRRWALPIWATGCLNYWCEAGSVDTAGRGCRICTGRRYLTYLPRHSPEYARATGLECLFGQLFLEGKTERINQLFVTVMEALYGI